MSCFSCGKSFSETDIQTVQRYKGYFDSLGIRTYFYRLSITGDVKIVFPSSFNTILETEIKPNFVNGADWSPIEDYKP